MKLLILCFSITLISCSSFNSKLEQNNQAFKVRNIWTYSSTNQEYIKHRKLNKASSLILDQYIVQSNGVDGLMIFNRNSGAPLYHIPVLNGAEGGVAGVQNRIFFGGGDGFFYSYDLKTKELIWKFNVKMEILSEPLVDQGVVYFLTGNNALYALDASNGQQKWLYSRIETSSFTIRGGAKPVISQNTLYQGFSDGVLVALNTKNGSVIWEKSLNRNKKYKDIDSHVVFYKNMLFVSGYDDALYCLDSSSAELLWKYSAGGYNPVSIIENQILYSTTDQEIVSLSFDGSVNWKMKNKNGMSTQLLSYNGYVIYGESEGALNFLNLKTKRIEHSFDPGRGIQSNIVIDDKNKAAQKIYFMSNEGNFYAIQASHEPKSTFNWLR